MEQKNGSGATIAIVALLVVAAIGAIYWFTGGVAASKALQTALLKQYTYLGAVLTVALIVVIALVLNRQRKKQ